ncbi:uncharacterized protein Tco025E_03017 [Trypanosoma conorhini]|uniref:Uncharacterized protein n=1 Tax=Trypanosoma conorhini TaxID=83891 RepID=A0A3S5ITQ1_9TRYP|nr:uncharacterized protein Tco025E_03017 [Trypanosoma conorhini]RNF22690.1 hypothetical protein Tco025E_03017 [Trypanosoma conorhini]
MGAFEAFLLAAAKRAPFAVGEAALTAAARRQPQKRLREDDAATDGGGGATKQPAAPEEDVARLQRLLVDGPLQPLGLEHAVYHVLLPAFAAAMGAAREVWRATAALQAAAEAAAPSRQEPGGGAPPSMEALQRAVAAAQTKLAAQRQLLDAAEAKLRVTVGAVTSACAAAQTPEGGAATGLGDIQVDCFFLFFYRFPNRPFRRPLFSRVVLGLPLPSS